MTDDSSTVPGTRTGSTPSVIHEGLPTQLPDIDPDETADWIASFDAMLDERGRDRARYVMLRAVCAGSRAAGAAAAGQRRARCELAHQVAHSAS